MFPCCALSPILLGPVISRASQLAAELLVVGITWWYTFRSYRIRKGIDIGKTFGSLLLYNGESSDKSSCHSLTMCASECSGSMYFLWDLPPRSYGSRGSCPHLQTARDIVYPRHHVCFVDCASSVLHRSHFRTLISCSGYLRRSGRQQHYWRSLLTRTSTASPHTNHFVG